MSKQMTVGQLKDILGAYPDDTPVVIPYHHCGIGGVSGEIDFDFEMVLDFPYNQHYCMQLNIFFINVDVVPSEEFMALVMS